MGFFKNLFSKGTSGQSDNAALKLTLRQLKEQNMHFKIDNEDQLDMTLGEWTELQKSNPHKEPQEPKYKTVHLVVDEKLINANDAQGVIEPLWWSVSIYDGKEKYESDLLPFSLAQRHVFAIQWYVAEVNNGGHDQFYYNSTGIVWEDALKAFEAIGALKNAEILKISADRMGGNPDKDREKRQDQLEQYEPDFDDLDTAYYKSEGEMAEYLFAYIKANAKDFYFSGDVTIPE